MRDSERFGTGEEEQDAKESQKDALVRLGSSAKFWHDADQQAFTSFSIKDHSENHALRSKAFKSWLIRQFYKETEKAPGSQAVEDALRVLDAKAVFDGKERQTYLRVAGADGCIYIDLGDESWHAIMVSPSGWQIISDPTVAFIRSRGLRPLPVPEPGGSIEELKALVNLQSEDDFKLFVGWLLMTLRPEGPFPILCLNGEQGSAKTTLARVARRLIDPNAADTRTIPREETDLLIAARNGWFISLDNMSEIRPWLSDALCRIATGGGFGTRQLYTNTDEILFEAKRPIIINGIPSLATRPDLGDRCLVLVLPTIPKRTRKPESTFWRRFEETAGRVLGVLLDAVVQALRSEAAVRDFAIEHQIELPRMADAALWVEAAAPALGWKPGDLLKLFLDNQAEVQKHIADADLVASAVQMFMEERESWEGTSSELLNALAEVVSEEQRRSKEWPKAANTFSNRLRQAAPGIRMTGLGVEERVLHGRTIWTLHKNFPEKDPTHPTYPTQSAENLGFHAESYPTPSTNDPTPDRTPDIAGKPRNSANFDTTGCDGWDGCDDSRPNSYADGPVDEHVEELDGDREERAALQEEPEAEHSRPWQK